MKKRVLSSFLALVLTLSLCVSGYAAEISFPDAKGHWAEETITTLATQGIVCGYPDGTVRPDDTISRAEFAVLTARVFGYTGTDAKSPFDDLADCWASPQIAALCVAGIICTDEYADCFVPKQFITRGEMTRILVRAIDGGKDCTDDESYAKASMGYGVLKGYPDGSLGLEKTTTRAEVFTMLLRTQVAKADYDKKAEEKKLVPTGGGGGYYVPPVPAAELSFALPETAYVGESVVIEATIKGAASVEWKLTVNGAEAVLPEDFKEIGGELTFTEAGEYILTGTAKNSAGKETVCTHSVTVYPVAALTLELPVVAHTDTAISAVLTRELCGLPVTWSLNQNGEAAELADCIEGALSDAGGELRVMDKGVYRLTATVTDALGREFSASADITVYPVGSAGFYLPDIFHTDDTVTVEAAFGEIGESFAVWTLTRDGAPVTLEAALTNSGGKLTVGKSGEYVLTASFTDAGGRSYSYSQSFKVYPVPTLSFTYNATAHTDTAVSVKTTAAALDGLSVDWLVDNTAGVQNWDTFVAGTLGNDGGSIRFKHAGTYELIATATDATGRVFLFESNTRCVVQPVLDMSFELPEILHTDDTVELRTLGNNNILPIAWSLTRDGKPVSVSSCIDGELNAYGGSICFKESGAYTLTATATDVLGRSFTSSGSTAVLPVVDIFVSAPAQVHIGAPIDIETSIQNLGSSEVIWTLSKNGESKTLITTLGNDGGSITLGAVGSYALTATVTDAAGREFFENTVFEITNTAPDMPSLTVTPTRTTSNGKFLVNISATGTDPDGDEVTFEYDDTSADGYYAVGQHTVKVRAVDSFGLASDWVSKTFTITNSAPTTPVITRSPDGNCVTPGTAVSISASSTDPDGDAITYVWENRPSDSYVYGFGRQVVRVKAVDSTGAESPWAAIIFFVASSSNGGGMTLTGPDSTIMENGIENATITSFTFTVPPVSGHNGSDYGRVRGYNRNTGAWDQLAYQTTNNGVTLTNTMSHGIYTQLEFYYYTNHNCMYNKSNITYSVEFYFE